MLATHRFPAASKASELGLTPVLIASVDCGAPLFSIALCSKRTTVWFAKLATHRWRWLSNAIATGLLSDRSFVEITVVATAPPELRSEAGAKAINNESSLLATHIVPSESKARPLRSKRLALAVEIVVAGTVRPPASSCDASNRRTPGLTEGAVHKPPGVEGV